MDSDVVHLLVTLIKGDGHYKIASECTHGDISMYNDWLRQVYTVEAFVLSDAKREQRQRLCHFLVLIFFCSDVKLNNRHMGLQ
jgi:hypothetical protein